ncbi:GTP cyclohydrolase II [Algicola sagamiensis]|uniref:GTP cyclohydrolase II n=1 Tax=Algicola sagamiensis TaxID=163869 RepID=UPI00037A9CDF|nr:GTP cyclohydrolase II [Algicola sagamiensis]
MATVRARASIKIGPQSDIPVDIVSFHDLRSESEHVAIIFNKADQQSNSPLVRLHSECLTGDVFHSSRCDCGEQLDETIERMRHQGGILLYLRQEGRGIGLYNKLDAYVLQSQGMNTYEANNHLGFGDDLREFDEAAEMLRALGIASIRLITNNPRKQKALQDCGIKIEKVVSTGVHIKDGNEHYLKTKAKIGQHKMYFD